MAERPNPFAADVCTGPFGVDENRSVPGLNADILQQLTGTIDERQSSVGLPGGQPLLLLTAPRAGYGKTHLLGRLAAAAGGQVVLVPLAFRLEDQIGISAVAVRGLESMARADTPREGWTKLREACAGVCAALVRRLIESGTLPCANPEQAMRVLNGNPVEVFDHNGSARLIGDWVRKHDAQLRKPMTEQAMRRVPAIPSALEQWVDAMLNHALDGGMSRVAVLRMLAAEEKNEGPVTWLRLLGLWRPVVLLVDHLDAYYRNPEAGLRIASLLLDMSEMDGVHVVLSLNQDVWQATFGHHLPSAMEDRLTASQMLLRGIGEAEAATLLRLRLDHAGVKGRELAEFESFVDVKRYFLGRPLGSVSARTFLRHVAKQWDFFQQTLASPPPAVAPLVPASAGAEEKALPLLTETVQENEEAADPQPHHAQLPPQQSAPAPAPLPLPEVEDPNAIFDSTTAASMRRMAEGLAEPQPALPQQDEAPLPLPVPPPSPSNGTLAPAYPQVVGEGAPPAAAMAAAADSPPPPNAGMQGSQGQSQFSPSSSSAFESLREMLGKLRQPSPGNGNGHGTPPAPQAEEGDASTAFAAAEAPPPASDLSPADAPTDLPPAAAPAPEAPPAVLGMGAGSAVGALAPAPQAPPQPQPAAVLPVSEWAPKPVLSPAPAAEAAPAPAAVPVPVATARVALPAYKGPGAATPEAPAAAAAAPARASLPPPPPASAVPAPVPAPAPAPVADDSEQARDALLGRYEALRLQMSAEAISLPLDYTKLAELIRLAGRRFPLVRFSEHELPGMTGRYAMCWSLQGMEIIFGLANFADGSYWRTLSGFAAGRLAELTAPGTAAHPVPPKLKIATFKTDREQQSWAILHHSTAFPDVLRPLVDAIHLDTSNVAALYAMQRIIKESESGALQATPAQVMSVLARELDFFWKRVTRMVRE